MGAFAGSETWPRRRPRGRPRGWDSVRVSDDFAKALSEVTRFEGPIAGSSPTPISCRSDEAIPRRGHQGRAGWKEVGITMSMVKEVNEELSELCADFAGFRGRVETELGLFRSIAKGIADKLVCSSSRSSSGSSRRSAGCSSSAGSSPP